MGDARLLAPDSDFSRFVAKGVDPDVRRTALKALFRDPHFQQMDGLDIYIGDYTRPSPLTPEMVAALWHAKSTLAPRPLYRTGPEPSAERAPPDDAPAPAPPRADATVPEEARAEPDADAPGDVTGDAVSSEGTPLPFNEQVNFSHGSASPWNRPEPV